MERINKAVQWLHTQYHEIVEDEEKAYELVRTMVGLFIGTSVIASATTFTLIYVQRGRLPEVFVSALLAWAGYLFTHYSVTGKLIHQRVEQRIIPTDPQRIAGGIFGASILAAGLAIAAMALGSNDVPATVLGVAIFFLGYVISHYELTGQAL